VNRILTTITLLLLFLICSCEDSQEEDKELVLPTNMSTTIVQGASSAKVIADFHYIPESHLLDHITWSNYQTHYFEYDDANRLKVVREEKVKEKVMEERWFRYDGVEFSEVILVKRNLDYTTLEPLDSSYTGHIDYDYEGKYIVGETEYRIQHGTETLYPVRESSYEYDALGNILKRSTTYLDGSGTDEEVFKSYDSGRHPFSDLTYYFTGESFVNNLLTRTVGNMDYTYEVRLDARDYPETIYEKLGSTYSRITSYTYVVYAQ
jgi:hypothetical protein